MSDQPTQPGLATVSEGGFTVTSNHQTEDELRTSLADPAEKPAEEPQPTESPADSQTGEPKTPAELPAEAETTGKAAEEAAQAEERRRHPRDDPKARIAQLSRQAKEAEQRLADERAERRRVEAELAKFRGEQKPAEQAKPPAGPGEDPEPQEDAFEDYKDYIKAQARWEARQEFRAAQEKAAQQAEVTQYWTRVAEHAQKFDQRLAEHAKTDPQFYEKTKPLAEWLQTSFQAEQAGQPITILNVLSDEIFSSEKAPALMLHFMEHAEELQRIATLGTPRGIAREMAKLEARLDVATTATNSRPTVSRANPPVRPVTGSPHTADTPPDPETSSVSEHIRYWNARDKKVAQR